LFVVPTATCRLLFVLVILAHVRRRVVHVAVTDDPTAAWTTQQLREAFQWNEAPQYLVHDRDACHPQKTLYGQFCGRSDGEPMQL
jgi:putative transposase